MDSAEKVLVFDAFFIFLIGLYGGTAAGSSANPFQSLSTISFPQLAPSPPQKNYNCAYWDVPCQGASVAQATAYIGWAIVNLPVLLIFFVSVFINFANIVLNTVFSPRFSPNGVPVIGFFFIMLQLIAIWGLIKVVRGVGGLAGSTL